MGYAHVIAPAIMMSLACSGCSSRRPDALEVPFRLTNQATAILLANTVVSVYDGFDKRLPSFAGPTRSNNARHHLADITTSTDGILTLDVGQLGKDALLLQAGALHKYVEHTGDVVMIMHYSREGHSLQVSAHYSYDLRAKLVTVTRFPGGRPDRPKAFSIIDVPLD